MFAHTEDEGLLVLEVHESAGGPGRYAIHDDGLAHPVAARAAVLAHELHTCYGRQQQTPAFPGSLT